MNKVAHFLAYLLLSIPNPVQAADNPKFSLPLNCTNDTQCFLQNMMDMKPGKNIRDPFCGTSTYNGHKGTDFRVKDLTVLHSGVPIFAIADGIVLRHRNKVPDKLMESKADRARVKGIECGNGIVIDHGVFNQQKWISQTCHLAKGSVRVKNGEKVKRGQVIAMMGLSGSTQFPHVHVSLKANNKLRDFLTGAPLSKINSSISCATDFTKRTLTQNAITTLRKLRTPLLSAGFSNSSVKGKDVIENKIKKPTVKGPLVFYAQFINLRKEDIVQLTILGPKGVYIENKTAPLKHNKATFTVFVGRRQPLEKGATYKGLTKIIRKGKIVFESKPVTIQF